MNYWIIPALVKFETMSKEKKTELIIEKVLYCTNITEEELMSKCRKLEIVRARQLVSYFLYNLAEMGVTKIGDRLKKHHSTVLYAKSKIQDYMFTEPEFKKFVLELEKKIME